MAWFLLFVAVVFGWRFWRHYRERQRELASPLAEHRTGMKHIGQVVVLDAPLNNGAGRARVGNRLWDIRGPDLPAGSKARVIGVDGTVLLVDRIAA
jgi:membrane protein implicated in regulation of membrane protease activity